MVLRTIRQSREVHETRRKTNASYQAEGHVATQSEALPAQGARIYGEWMRYCHLVPRCAKVDLRLWLLLQRNARRVQEESV